jgi:hypothetical protein
MRYTIDIANALTDDAEKFKVVDGFTGKTIADNLEGEVAESRASRMNADFKEACDMAEALTSFAQHTGAVREFAAAMERQHRTLQQSTMRLFVAWVESLAETKDGRFDARNEGTVKLAKALVASPAWDKKHLPYV